MKVISVVGYKKSGKTALVTALVRKLSEFGAVGTVKHLGEQRLNPAETDTGRHFDAGADMVIGITGTGTAGTTGITGSSTPGTELVSFSRDRSLEDALDMLCDQGFDFAVVEGFKESNLPKIVLGNLQGVSKIVFRVPEDIDMHEELTTSLVEIALVQPDRYTLEALIKKAQERSFYPKSRCNRHFYWHCPRIGRKRKNFQARIRKIRTRSLKSSGQNKERNQAKSRNPGSPDSPQNRHHQSQRRHSIHCYCSLPQDRTFPGPQRSHRADKGRSSNLEKGIHGKRGVLGSMTKSKRESRPEN